MENNDIYSILNKKLFCDCIIKYECVDDSGEFKSHRILLATLPYFLSLFQLTNIQKEKLKPDDIEEFYIINIKLLCLKKTFLRVMEELYNNESDIKCDATDLLNLMYFLGINDEKINKYICSFMVKLNQEANYQEKVNMISKFCNISSISNDIKKNFIARFYYVLNDEDSKQFHEEFIEIFPENYFKNKTFIEDKKIFISNINVSRLMFHNSIKEIIYNGIKFETYATFSDQYESSFGFWIRGSPENENLIYNKSTYSVEGAINMNPINAKIILRIYDGFTTKNKKINKQSQCLKDEILVFPNKIKLLETCRERYGLIVYDYEIDENIVYEMEITILD